MPAKTFSKDELKETLYGDSDTLESVQDKAIGSSRWTEHREMVFRERGTDNFYSVTYEQGLTEQQDIYPFQDDPDDIECPQVEPYQQSVTLYRAIA